MTQPKHRTVFYRINAEHLEMLLRRSLAHATYGMSLDQPETGLIPSKGYLAELEDRNLILQIGQRLRDKLAMQPKRNA